MRLFFDYIATKQIIAPVTEYAGRKFLEGVRSLKGDEGKPIAIRSTSTNPSFCVRITEE